MKGPRRWFGSVKQSIGQRMPYVPGPRMNPEKAAETLENTKAKRHAALISAKSVKRADFKSFL